MIIVMKSSSTDGEKEAVKRRLTDLGFDIHQSTGIGQTIYGAIGEVQGLLIEQMQALAGVEDAFRVICNMVSNTVWCFAGNREDSAMVSVVALFYVIWRPRATLLVLSDAIGVFTRVAKSAFI